jgi:hypothetical protein
LAQALESQRLLQLGGARLSEAAGDLLDNGFHAHWQDALRGSRSRSLALSALTAHAIELLEREGVVAMPLKGPALAVALHGDPGMRPCDDVDLLVAASELPRAIEVIRSLGYQESPWAPPHPLHQAMIHPDLGMPQIELHWRIHWYESRFSQAVLDRASRDEQGQLRPRAPDELAMLLLFFARDGFLGLRLAADVAACWDQRGGEIATGALAQIAAEHPELGDALSASVLVAERLVGLPARQLGLDGDRSRRQRRAARLANWCLRGDVQQMHANVKLVDWMLTPPAGRVEYIRRHLLRRTPGQPALVQALHSCKLLARYGLALWAIRGGRSWAPLPGNRMGVQ